MVTPANSNVSRLDLACGRKCSQAEGFDVPPFACAKSIRPSSFALATLRTKADAIGRCNALLSPSQPCLQSQKSLSVCLPELPRHVNGGIPGHPPNAQQWMLLRPGDRATAPRHRSVPCLG